MGQWELHASALNQAPNGGQSGYIGGQSGYIGAKDIPEARSRNSDIVLSTSWESENIKNQDSDRGSKKRVPGTNHEQVNKHMSTSKRPSAWPHTNLCATATEDLFNLISFRLPSSTTPCP